MNRYVSEQDIWTEIQMKERGKRLADRALKIWPYHDVSDDDINVARVQDLRDLEAQGDLRSIDMDDAMRTLLTEILEAISHLGNDVVQIVENKSVSLFRPPEFFCELLPMSDRIRAMLPLDYNEVIIPADLWVQDASTWKFVPHRVHSDCEVFVNIYRGEDIETAMPLVRQAFEQA